MSRDPLSLSRKMREELGKGPSLSLSPQVLSLLGEARGIDSTGLVLRVLRMLRRGGARVVHLAGKGARGDAAATLRDTALVLMGKVFYFSSSCYLPTLPYASPSLFPIFFPVRWFARFLYFVCLFAFVLDVAS